MFSSHATIGALANAAWEDRFGSGLIHGFTAVFRALWHSFPHHDLTTPYHLGYIIGWLVSVALLVFIVNRLS